MHHPTAASGQNTGNEKEKPSTKAVVHENIYTIPNILTASRLVAAPVIGYSILTGSHTLALSLFAYAAITDLVDGYIARRWNQQTVVGTVIDPMADKFLMTIGVVCLAMKAAIPSTFSTHSFFIFIFSLSRFWPGYTCVGYWLTNGDKCGWLVLYWPATSGSGLQPYTTDGYLCLRPRP